MTGEWQRPVLLNGWRDAPQPERGWWPGAGRVRDGGRTDVQTEVHVDYEADPNQGGRLRLRRRVLWSEQQGHEGADGPPHAWLMLWAVDGMAGAVSLNVQVGGFRSGSARGVSVGVLGEGASPGGNQDIGHQILADHWVEGGLAANGVYVHAYRPWPVPGDHQDETAACPVLEERCWSQQVLGDHDPAVHELLVRLVQPGGGEFVWERLESMYRDEFAVALSPGAYAARQRERGAELAAATARGAEMAAAMGAEPEQAHPPVSGSFGPVQEMQPADAVKLNAPFLLSSDAHDGRWVTVERASDDEHGLRVWVTVLGGDAEPWELHRARTVRVRGPL